MSQSSALVPQCGGQCAREMAAAMTDTKNHESALQRVRSTVRALGAASFLPVMRLVGCEILSRCPSTR